MNNSQPNRFRADGAEVGETDAVVTTDTDEAFAVLSSAERRFALVYLRRQSGPVAPEQLATALAEWEEGPDDADEARIQLHHVHLPKLEDAGFVTYGDRVELDEAAAEPLGILDGA